VSFLEEILDKPIAVEYEALPSNYIMETLADTEKARRELGFAAKVPLRTGIELINDYYINVNGLRGSFF